MEKIITKGAAETQKFARKMAAAILREKPPARAVVLALSGELGAGKTTFLQGFAEGLGIGEMVNSPTFVILKRFQIPGGGFESFYHFDCYRLENAEDVARLGFGEIIANPKNIVAIEWPEKISAALPANCITVILAHLPGGAREISVL